MWIIGVIIVLVAIIIMLILFNIKIHKEINNYKNINQKINGLNVLQDFMATAGDAISVDEKIRKINEILIEEYDIKYSTIVEFNGTEYVIKASNVEEKHWDNLRSLHNEEIFRDSITTATPKYITVDQENERLPYQKSEFGRAKAAMFFPLYIENVYIGYWIIESGVPHDFDDVDTTIFEIVKENIITVLKTTMHQKTLEAIVRKDLFSGLNTSEYLYGEAKQQIDRYTMSAVCMLKITNLKEINETYSRQLGNKVITKVAEYIEENISEEYIFVRHQGPKFIIVFSGVDPEDVVEFLNDIKITIEKKEISLEQELESHNFDDEELINIKKRGRKRKSENSQVAIPRLNFVISRYYKGTGMQELVQSLEDYLDSANENESDINNI